MNFALFMLYLQFTFFLWRNGQTRVHKEAPPELKKRYSVKNIYLWQEQNTSMNFVIILI